MDENFTYKVYGLIIQSNQALVGLERANSDLPIDLKIDIKTEYQPQFTPNEVDIVLSGFESKIGINGKPKYHLWFLADGKLDFEINSEINHISATNISAKSDNDVIKGVMPLFLGPALACVLRLRGELCLHASVINLNNQAVAFVGASGAGKSTLAAFLSQKGYSILSDDVAVIRNSNDCFIVESGYPRIKLWKESINSLYESEEDLERVFEFVEKRFIKLNKDSYPKMFNFSSNPLPLGAIYILGERDSNNTAPVISPVPASLAVMKLMANRSVSNFNLELTKNQQAKEFAGFSKLSTYVPIRHIKRNDSLEKLPELCDAILKDFDSISS